MDTHKNVELLYYFMNFKKSKNFSKNLKTYDALGTSGGNQGHFSNYMVDASKQRMCGSCVQEKVCWLE